MPVDFDESRMLGELQDLEDEIAIVELIKMVREGDRVAYSIDDWNFDKTIDALGRIVKKLQQDKERLESRLKIHRQKVKESGVKF